MSGIIKGLSLQGIRETFDNIKESRKEFQRESKQKKNGTGNLQRLTRGRKNKDNKKIMMMIDENKLYERGQYEKADEKSGTNIVCVCVFNR